MEFISFLSSKIELTAIAVSNAILIIFPFLDIYLSSPENIMIIIGFGGQALFAKDSNSMDYK